MKKKFVDLHKQATVDSLQTEKLDAVNAYNSLILNRHQFVHKGSLTLSLTEARKYVDLAPRVLECVATAFK